MFGQGTVYVVAVFMGLVATRRMENGACIIQFNGEVTRIHNHLGKKLYTLDEFGNLRLTF